MAEYHWGPQIAKFPVKGAIGAEFTIGIALMFLFALPQARLFALISVPFGMIVGIVLYFWHKRRPVEYTDIDPYNRP